MVNTQPPIAPTGQDAPDIVAGPALVSAEDRLLVEPFKGTPGQIERQWYEQVYLARGRGMRQLTFRALLMGSLLGGILSLTNLYIGLKAGWGFGVAITACILSYAIWTVLLKIGLVRTPMTILENNCMQSTASSAGYSTGSTLTCAFAAYIMLTGHSLPLPILLGWVFFLAVLGVTMAIPMKRQMINVEQLRFPSGVAAAETLRALHAHGEGGMRAAKALGWSGLIAAMSTFWMDGLRLVSAKLEPFSLSALITKVNETLIGKTWMGRTVLISWDPIFIAAGAITGMRVGVSMLVGAILCWMVYVPLLQSNGVTTATGFRDLVQWTLWSGTACMVTSGLMSFVLQWRSAVRAFANLGGMLKRRKPSKKNSMEEIEVPGSWFIYGQLFALIGIAILAHHTFQMPYWQSALAVVLSFGLALVACRVTGETDCTPLGAMGKVAQLIFGGVNPGNAAVNLMGGNVAAGAAISSADLLTDLKSGYLLGAHPRKQFLAQFAGIFIGTIVTVVCFNVLVPSASVLGTDQFPAPSAQTWKAVAEVLSKGIATLGPVKSWSLAGGALLGVILPLLAARFPRYEKYIPSAAGFGLAWTFHWYYSVLFFIGGFLAWAFEKGRPKLAQEFTFPVASGVIAGGSLMGVMLIFWENGWEIMKKMLGF
jgi:OPT family oligopeptide transporter